MANINTNALSTFLSVYAYKSLPAFVSNMPPRDIFTENFDESVGTVGQSVVTRISTTTSAATLNNIASGWENQNASSSNITATLATKGHDQSYTMTEWATIGEAQLLNVFANQLAAQVANGIACEVMSNVSSSFFTNTVTIPSASLFAFTGANSLQSIGTVLSNAEIPQNDRYAILTPNAYTGVISGIYQQYTYGDPTLIRNNGWKGLDGNNVNSAYPGLYLAGMNVFQYARLNSNTATLPYGGSTVLGAQKLAGFAGNRAGLVLAARAPITVNDPLFQSYTVIDPTSGFPLQFVLALDPSFPGFRLGVYSLFGSAPGNPNAIVPIISSSGY